MNFIGIDPGKKGGIACLNDAGDLVFFSPMPCRADGFLDIRTAANSLLELRPGHIALERAQAFPKQGLVSTGRYLEDFGKLLAVAELFWQLKYRHYPRPQTWKTILTAGTDKTAAVAFVAAHHPEATLILPRKRKPHDGVADAICIAHWCRLTHSTTAGSL